MAAGATAPPAANGTHPSTKRLELAIALPHSPGTKINLALEVSASSILLFLTSSHAEAGQSNASLGSFVYAIPDRYNPSQPMCTPLYSQPSSLDLATRMAKVLARRTGRPCYVGSSINLSGAAGGGSVEEEMEAFRAVVEVVMVAVQRAEDAGDG